MTLTQKHVTMKALIIEIWFGLDVIPNIYYALHSQAKVYFMNKNFKFVHTILSTSLLVSPVFYIIKV